MSNPNAEIEQQAQPIVWDPTFAFDDADLVIRSADGIHFKVHKLLMRMISDVFKDMTALDQVNKGLRIHCESEHEMEHVQITESSDTLNFVLRMAYHLPLTTLSSPTLDQLSDILVMLDKYHMQHLSNSVQNFILLNMNLETNPLWYYIRAREYNLPRLKQAALPHVCALDLLAHVTNPGMKVPAVVGTLSFRDYHRLLYFTKRRASWILALVENIELDPILLSVQCPNKNNLRGYLSKCCSWEQYLTAARQEVNTSSHRDILRPELRIRVAIESKCPNATMWLLRHCAGDLEKVRLEAKKIPWEYEEDYRKSVILFSPETRG
ncbi:hypothetical protein SISNIDRAFT_533147 [Sistotremastrum niveocremeum HHB9708]|uniref:BTB domain-containing protein n=1 Tax=Sistotremastrum niveocremeum HHB9708 TaxID=1314777 RepID=A0A164Y5I5_9AGAM|nr:hypothetical protein SISNIDRAFT_533147 [Sistotremastrum niveocremeum HHB9708]